MASINYFSNITYLKTLDTNGEISPCLDSNRMKLCSDIKCKDCYLRSFASVILPHPTIYWSHTKNNQVSPRDILKHSSKKCWLECCECKHKFEKTFNSFSKGLCCSYCTGRKLCNDEYCEFCYDRSFASCSLSKYWDYDYNEPSPREIFKGTGCYYRFICSICKHGFIAKPNHVSCGHFCPYCTHKKLCDDEDCVFCYENSFASHPFADYWNVGNNKLAPRNVFITSAQKFEFICQKCKESFSAKLNELRDSKHWHIERVKKPILCGDEDCNECYDRSFASHSRCIYWNDELNLLTPFQVCKFSHTKGWFRCIECDHNFSATLENICGNGRWCPYCAHKKLCDDEDCVFCYENSFASHERSDYWDYINNEKEPRQVFRSSNQLFYFLCDIHGSFPMRIGNIYYRGDWCPKCQRSHGEEILINTLAEKDIMCDEQKSFEGLIYRRKLRYDVYFVYNNQQYIIEYDGDQHFTMCHFYNTEKTFEELQEKDLMKTKYCVDNNIRLLRISYLHYTNIELLVDIFLNSDFKCIFSDYDLYEGQIIASGGIAASY
jgi:hypothetical protein